MQAGNGAFRSIDEHAALRSLTQQSLRRSVSAKPVFRSASIAPAATSRGRAEASPPSSATSSTHQTPPPTRWARHSISSAAATTSGLEPSHLQRVSSPLSRMLSRTISLSRKAALELDAEGEHSTAERGVLDSGDYDDSSDSDSEPLVRNAPTPHQKALRPQYYFNAALNVP